MATQQELQQRALLARAAAASEEVSGFRSFFTGEGRTEGYPELGTSGPSMSAFKDAEPLPERYAPPGSPHKPLQTLDIRNVKKQARMIGAYTATPDPKATGDIALKTLKEVAPDTTMDEDQYGNPTITFEGKKYYINAPGASTADMFTLLGQIGAYAPAMRLSKARNLFTRMRQMGYLSFATSAGLDRVAGELGSEQGVDWTRALLTGATGALFEGLAPVVVHAWRTVLNRPGMFDASTGQLTAKGKELALEAGLDPEMMTRRLAQTFAREVRDESTPALAGARAVQGVTGTKLTRGQQLLQAGESGQITWEQLAKSGSIEGGGERAATVLGGAEHPRAGFLGQQESAAEEFAEEIGEKLAKGGRQVGTEAEGGAIVGEGVKREITTLEGKIDDAYNRFRASHGTLRGGRSGPLERPEGTTPLGVRIGGRELSVEQGRVLSRAESLPDGPILVFDARQKAGYEGIFPTEKEAMAYIKGQGEKGKILDYGTPREIEEMNPSGPESIEFIYQQLDDLFKASDTESAFRSDFIYKGLDDALEDFDIVPDLTPGAHRVRELLRDEIGKNEPITARSIEVLRKRMRNHWDSAKKADKKAVGRVISAYDEWLDRAVTDGFFDGDQAAIDLVKEARKLRTEKRMKFGVDDKYDDPGKIIEDIVYRDADGQEIINYLFGKAQLGDKKRHPEGSRKGA